MGISLYRNPILSTANVKFMLTLKSEYINSITTSADFQDRKYNGITGVCDETEMTEDDVRKLVDDFIVEALSWRRENDKRNAD